MFVGEKYPRCNSLPLYTAKLHVTEKMMHHIFSWASKNMDAGHRHGQMDKKKIKD